MPNYSFPPDWVNRATAVYLTGLTGDQFDAYVRTGVLPQPVQHGNRRLWDRQAVNAALATLSHDRSTIEPDQDILAAARGDGKAKGNGRRGLAQIHS